ncbi:MAG: hypothetical protein GX130_06770 [Candidatus Hydrogenedens sp.]|jgi:hypothetical protein|nr:hypothetical protein [Candidatus Hydrogenedens sp.]
MWKRLFKALPPIFISLILTLFLVALIDIALGFISRTEFTTSVDSPIYDGFLLASDKTITQTFKFPEGIHEVKYTLTPRRYRYTPVDHPDERSSFVAFMGCSLIFGTTVNDDETIPFHAAKHNNKIMPYNFGKPGGALQLAWYHLQQTDFEHDLHQDNGVFLYLWADFHLRRTIGGIPSPENTVDSLCVQLEDSRIVARGSFRDEMPGRWCLYSFLRRTHIPWHLGLTFPLSSPNSEDWDLIATLFQEMERKTKSSFPESRFVIIFFNAPLGEKEIPQRLQNTDGAIEYLDLNLLMEKNNVSLKHFPDKHFYPETNKTLAELIIDALEIQSFCNKTRGKNVTKHYSMNMAVKRL